MNRLAIRPLAIADAPGLHRLLTADPADYRRHFTPFDFSTRSIRSILARARRDRYWGIWLDRRWAAFFMLRGMDEGLEHPSFGIYVAAHASGRNLSRIALSFSIAWCEAENFKKVRLSVHPDNRAALKIYEEAGFAASGPPSPKGHRVYFKVLRS